MKKVIILAFFIVLFSGCGWDSMPHNLKKALPPITIKAVNEGGIILVDGNGKLYCYESNYHIAQIIIKSDLKPGDILIPKKED